MREWLKTLMRNMTFRMGIFLVGSGLVMFLVYGVIREVVVGALSILPLGAGILLLVVGLLDIWEAHNTHR